MTEHRGEKARLRGEAQEAGPVHRRSPAPPAEPPPQRAPAAPSEPVSLFEVLDGRRPPSRVVAWKGRSPLSHGEWCSSVAAVADLARASGGERWMLACEDAWSFSFGLFGLLAAGRTVCLPSGLVPTALSQLSGEVDRTLSDVPAPGTGLTWHALPAPSHGAGQSAVAGPPRIPRIPDGLVEFWTSGSTGLPKRVPKRFSQLADEVAMQERTFGARFGGGPVVGTVPHVHIYGCLFRILWPLHAGRPFRTEQCGDPSAFLRALAGSPPAALVSCPAHLSRLPRVISFDRIEVPPAVVFSSGGPLDPGDAQPWRLLASGGVVEVYGSTESGGIAWRSPGPSRASLAWTPLPGVELAQEEDGALLVTSPYAGPGPLRMEDAADFLPRGRFRLLGRLDRIVKLEEKRISLPEVETGLASHPWVARVTVVPLGGERGSRATLGAAVVLADEARPLLAAGRDAIVHALVEHLAQRVDRAAVPRRWRFVDELPVDEAGKIVAASVAELFGEKGSIGAPGPPGGSIPS